jgi:hypothetical protein
MALAGQVSTANQHLLTAHHGAVSQESVDGLSCCIEAGAKKNLRPHPGLHATRKASIDRDWSLAFPAVPAEVCNGWRAGSSDSPRQPAIDGD